MMMIFYINLNVGIYMTTNVRPKKFRCPAFSRITWFFCKSPGTLEFLKCPVFLEFHVFPELLGTPDLFGCPLFLEYHYFPELPTASDIFTCPFFLNVMNVRNF